MCSRNVKEYWILICVSLILVGNYFAYDLPAAMHHLLFPFLFDGQKDDSQNYEFRIQLLYSVYSIPNIIIPFVTGFAVHRLGQNLCLLLASSFVLLGQLAISFGIQGKSFALIVAGRLLFGIGGESLSILQSQLSVFWFKGSKLALSLALNVSVSRMGSLLNDILSPRIAEHFGVVMAFWSGTLFCLFSYLIATYLLFELQWENGKKYQIPPGEEPKQLKESIGFDLEQQKAQAKSTEAFELTPLSNSSTSLQLDASNAKIRQSSVLDINTQGEDSEGEGRGSLQRAIATIRSYPMSYWVICLLIVLYYSIVIPFNTIEGTFVGFNFFDGDYTKARSLMSISDAISILLGPLTGILQDKYGNRVYYLVISSVGYLLGHFSLLFVKDIHPAFAITCFGISNLCILSVWACIARLCSASESIGLGLATSLMNAALTISPLFVAWISQFNSVTNSFWSEELFFLSCAGVSLFLVLLILFKLDSKGILKKPEDSDSDK